MNLHTRPSAALALAVTLTLAAVAPAAGQTAVGQNGGALDANQAVGSGGRYTGSASNQYQYGTGYGGYGSYGSFGNNLITGNITGGRQFRGDIGYTDSRSFRDDVGGSSFDAFSRSSSGVTTGGQSLDYASRVAPYYGDQTVAQPPAAFVQTPGTGGYVPARITGDTADLSDYDAARRAGALPEGTDSPLSRLFAGGAVDADLRVERTAASDAAASQSLVAGAELAAERGSLGELGGRSLSPYTQLGRDARLAALDAATLRSLQGELLRDAGEAGEEGGEPVDPRADQDAAVQERLDTLNQAARQPGNLAADDPMRRLVDPGEQSALYAQLERRLERFRSDPLADSLRPGGLDRERQSQQQADPLPGFERLMPGFGGVPGLDGGPLDLDAPEGVDPAPSELPGAEGADVDPVDPAVQVQSFANGVTSPTLKRLLEEAETLLQEGRYVSAITRFSAAEQLVPNQPLVALGRATAELGAGYYRRAADDLRGLLARNPELTMARVDVAALLGQARFDALAEDLRQRAQADESTAEPLFLLAFLSYGEGNYTQAATLLDLARDRSNDAFYTNVKRAWALDARSDTSESEPTDTPAAEAESTPPDMEK